MYHASVQIRSPFNRSVFYYLTNNSKLNQSLNV